MVRRGSWLPPLTRQLLTRLAAACGVAIPDGYGADAES
jgi:hypothetical protein